MTEIPDDVIEALADHQAEDYDYATRTRCSCGRPGSWVEHQAAAVWPLAVAHATRDEAAIGAEYLRRFAAVELEFAETALMDERYRIGYMACARSAGLFVGAFRADSLAPVGTPSGNDTGALPATPGTFPAWKPGALEMVHLPGTYTFTEAPGAAGTEAP